MVVTREMLAAKFETIFPHLDERQRRLLLEAEARALGMRRALTQTRHLLYQHGHRIEPVTAPPDLPARIPPYVPRRTATLKTSPKTKKRVNYLRALSDAAQYGKRSLAAGVVVLAAPRCGHGRT